MIGGKNTGTVIIIILLLLLLTMTTHVHCKSGNISEMMLDKDVVTTNH